MLIGATPEGRKELVGFTDGARESTHDWRDLRGVGVTFNDGIEVIAKPNDRQPATAAA